MVGLPAPYIIPLFLGMTFDARYTRPGVDIFDMKYVDDPAVNVFGTTESEFTITESTHDVKDALKIEGDISLKIKSGMLDISGKGSYIKHEADFTNRVEILTTMQYTSKVTSFKAGAKPRKDWEKSNNPSVLGTHYVSSVTYGAELIASLRFVVYNSSDLKEVNGEVNAAFGSDRKGVDLVAKGKLENLEKKLEGKANLEISYYGTVPLKSIPNTIEGLRTLVNNFKEQIEETELQDGIPMSVELTPLTHICDPDNRNKFEFLKNKKLEKALGDFEDQFDEMRKARLDLTTWAKSLPYELEPRFETRIGKLLRNITSVLEVYYDTIWAMDLTKGANQLDNALATYDYDGDIVTERYGKLVRKLKAELTPQIKWDDVASDTYVQWGNGNCTTPSSKTLYSGFVFSSSEEGIGGSASYSCAPSDWVRGYRLKDEDIKSQLAGIRYTDFDKHSNPFHGPYTKQVPGMGIPCAKCYSSDSATVSMFPATGKCPLTWEYMYRGYLMSARSKDGHSTEYICVDEYPSQPYQMESQPSGRDTAAITVVHTDGSLPKETYPDSSVIECVVCSMKSNQIVL